MPVRADAGMSCVQPGDHPHSTSKGARIHGRIPGAQKHAEPSRSVRGTPRARRVWFFLALLLLPVPPTLPAQGLSRAQPEEVGLSSDDSSV